VNKQRRKAISIEITYFTGKIELLQAAIEAGTLVAEDFSIDAGSVETIRDDEQEAYDNLPESMQGGDRGDAMQEAIQNLEEAISSIEEAEGLIEDSRTPDDESPQEIYAKAVEVLEAAVETLDNAAA
jgi:predicted RNase H-like HicB family nuclease